MKKWGGNFSLRGIKTEGAPPAQNFLSNKRLFRVQLKYDMCLFVFHRCPWRAPRGTTKTGLKHVFRLSVKKPEN